MAETPIRFGFPMFTKSISTDYIVKNKNICISDIWAFWDYAIRMHKKNKAGVNLEFMLSLVEQAQYFYTAALSAPIKSQPLLYYYSFLNLAKIVINMDTFHGTTVKYMHGISNKIEPTTTLSNAELKISDSNIPQNKYSIASEFMKLMGDNFAGATYPLTLLVKNLLKGCVGIHRAYCETYNEKEIFHRLLSSHLQKNGMNLNWESRIKDCDSTLNGLLVANGYSIDTRVENGITNYYLKNEFVMTHYTPTRDDFFQLSQQTLQKGLWSHYDADEIRYYISEDCYKYSSASIIYLLMFFLGSITRYHPYLFDNLISDKERWLVGEFLKNQPKQFLYYVTSRTIGGTLSYKL